MAIRMQVYTSQGSGIFAVDQAFAAYQRFGFTNCQLFREADSVMYATLISNLQTGYPAHLAVENPAGTAGHNTVVDGYRPEDGRFHINYLYVYCLYICAKKGLCLATSTKLPQWSEKQSEHQCPPSNTNFGDASKRCP